MKFDTVWDSEYWMGSNDLFCGFNMPEALKTSEGETTEYKHRLPPYARRKSYLVDEYPACPSDWMKSEGRLTSYFVPIKEGKGVWLDFNKNSEKKYHVAIVISVQGINPITGMPCKDAQLEQYIDTCPKHNIKFGPNRYCEKCDYRWPKQNYISSTGNTIGELWIDGFRSAQGVVRQYILTKEDTKHDKKGVASNIIGKDRVFAIGISFFLSKEQKKYQPTEFRGRGIPIASSYNPTSNSNYKGGAWANVSKGSKGSKGGGSSASDHDIYTSTSYTASNDTSWQLGLLRNRAIITDNEVSLKDLKDSINICTPSSLMPNDSDLDYLNNSDDIKLSAATACAAACAVSDDLALDVKSEETKASKPLRSRKISKIDATKLEVGAGANINQIVGDDPEPLDFWRKEPESILCINYILEDEAVKIIKSGRVSKTGHKEGFLKEIPVGN